MNRAVRYALGLLVEEMGEALCHIGRALRFGLDTAGQDGISERDALAKEIGDVRAAADFAAYGGVFSAQITFEQRDTKLRKLMDPESKDNLGRQLAPQPADFLKGEDRWDGETF